MQKALDIVFEIFNKIINFMFTSYIFDGVSLGMIILVCMLFALMISTIVNVPSGINNVLDRKISRSEKAEKESFEYQVRSSMNRIKVNREARRRFNGG